MTRKLDILPAKLDEKVIVKHPYKGDDERVIKLLTGIGFYYDEHIAVIEHLVKRATYFAKQEKRQSLALEHFQKALEEIR